MRELQRSLWRDEAGFIVSAELVMVGSLLVIGLIVGLAGVQEAVIGEYQDVAGALRGLDQSYAYSGMHGCLCSPCSYSSWTAGSSYAITGSKLPVCFDYATPGCDGCLVPPPIVGPTPVIPLTEPCTSRSNRGIHDAVQPRGPCSPETVGVVLDSPQIPLRCSPLTMTEPVVRPCECASSDQENSVTLDTTGDYSTELPPRPFVW